VKTENQSVKKQEGESIERRLKIVTLLLCMFLLSSFSLGNMVKATPAKSTSPKTLPDALGANQQYFYQGETNYYAVNYSINIVSMHNSWVNFFYLNSDGINSTDGGNLSTGYFTPNGDYEMSNYMVTPNLNVGSLIPYGNSTNATQVVYLQVQKILNISVCGQVRQVVFANTSTSDSYIVQEWDRATGVIVYYASYAQGAGLTSSYSLTTYGAISDHFFSPPTIYNNLAPNDLILTQGEEAQITWILSGIFEKKYWIYLDGKPVSSNYWISTQEITYYIPTNLTIGNHMVEIIVYNRAGQSANNSQRIIVQSPPTSGPSYIVLFLDIFVCGVAAVVYLQKRSESKRVTRPTRDPSSLRYRI
jgi:hypothetical protein